MKYTFSEEVKSELCQVEVLSVEEAQAELVGFLKGKGVILKTNLETLVSLEIGVLAAARRIMTLLNKIGIDKSKLTLVQKKMKRKRVQIFVPYSILDKLNISVLEIPSYLNDDIGFIGAFLRGVFVACGSITDPAKHYHFEIISQNEHLLHYLDHSLAEYVGISGNVGPFGDYAYRYFVKRGKDIQELLELMGASRVANYYGRIVNSREIKSDINRSLNFISANAKKSGESAARQLEAINTISEKIGLDKLPGPLRQLALARLEHVDLPLEELGRLVKPAMTKSMVYVRMQKILKIGEFLKDLDKSEIDSKIVYVVKRMGTVDKSRRRTTRLKGTKKAKIGGTDGGTNGVEG